MLASQSSIVISVCDREHKHVSPAFCTMGVTVATFLIGVDKGNLVDVSLLSSSILSFKTCFVDDFIFTCAGIW